MKPQLLSALLCLSFLVGCSSTPAIVRADKQPLPGSIAVIEQWKINGSLQTLQIRGESMTNPVILFLHGGPGSAELPLIRKYLAPLEKRYTVVAWDQRGSGKSYSAADGVTLTIDLMMNDAHEVTRLLKERFNQDKIYLMGHSWGGFLGFLMADRYPEDYYAYAAISPALDMVSNELLCYDFTLREAKARTNLKAVRELTALSNYPFPLDNRNLNPIMTQRGWLVKFGGALYGKTDYSEQVDIFLAGPEYGIFDLLPYLLGTERSMKSLWPEIMTHNLSREIPALKLPVYFFIGAHDYNTPFTIAQNYYSNLSAPRKAFYWFEHSAHSPCYEEPALFCERVSECFNNH